MIAFSAERRLSDCRSVQFNGRKLVELCETLFRPQEGPVRADGRKQDSP